MLTSTRRTALATLATLSALLSAAAPAQAAFQLNNVGLQCSESLVTQEGDAFVLSCVGDLSVQGLGGRGSFQADSSIRLSATGTLSLTDVVLRAPTIALYGEAGVKLLSGQTGLVGTDVSLSSARTVEMGGFIDAYGNQSITAASNRIDGRTDGSGSAGGTLSVSGSVDIDLRPGAGVILTGNGGRDATQVGEIVIRGSGSLSSNDPKFGNNQLPTLGSPVPEASTAVMAGLGLMVLAGLVARSRKTR